MGTRSKVKKDKVQKCYYCGQPISSLEDLVIKKFPMATKSGVRQFNRKLHTKCLLKYNEEYKDAELKTAENKEWDALYRYFKEKVLGLPETVNLDTHTVKRLLGLRLGKYYPSGNNTRILPRGYSFTTILTTLKVVNPLIQKYLATTNFKNSQHMVNGIMKIVASEINDVQRRMDNQKKSNEKLEKFNTEEVFDYKAKLKEQRKKESNSQEQETDVQKNLKKLFGGKLWAKK